MHSYYFTLSLSYDNCIHLYQPGKNSVVITSDCGKRVQLPVKNIRPFIERNGLNGRFRLVVNNINKVSSFEKVS
ncbi:MAG: hypothetical protein ACI808_002421 [Paraglaciecola sp.]|jgi:hypothetical protein